MKWWRGASGEWRAVNWYADDDRQGNEDGDGEKRGFDDVWREEVDGS